MHVHFSLLDKNKKNIFNNNTDLGSKTLKNAVGGILDSLKDSTLILAPHFNSYKRLRPGTHAPLNICWGYENRTAAIRIPGGDYTSKRIEHRVAGADANPYLVLSSILASALEGILKKIEFEIKIPKHSEAVKTESLNLSVSLGIVLSKIRI